jgi:hypothetical protein
MKMFKIYEMAKITKSNEFHKSHRKYKSEYGRTRTSEYIRGNIRGGIRWLGGVRIPCRHKHFFKNTSSIKYMHMLSMKLNTYIKVD